MTAPETLLAREQFVHYAKLRDALPAGPLRDAMSALIEHRRGQLAPDRVLVAQMAAGFLVGRAWSGSPDSVRVPVIAECVRVARELLAEVDRPSDDAVANCTRCGLRGDRCAACTCGGGA
jgi:hypothetical protein